MKPDIETLESELSLLARERKHSARDKMTRRKFIRRAFWLGSGALGASTLGWSTQIEPEWISVSRVALLLPRLSPAFEGLTLAQISDIHMSSWMTPERLRHVVRSVNGLKPDIVAVTGDFVSRHADRHARDLAQGLSALAPRLDAFAVLGNHDHWSNAKAMRGAIKKSGVQELQNSFHTLRRDGVTLHIAGLDDAWVGAADMEGVVRRLPDKGAVVLLAHEPDFADEYAQCARFDAMLSGHSHGGQVRVPGKGPILLPRYGQKYHTGRYHVGTGEKKLSLYVNRGVGMVRPYVRFNCRPEITLFTLRSPRAD